MLRRLIPYQALDSGELKGPLRHLSQAQHSRPDRRINRGVTGPANQHTREGKGSILPQERWLHELIGPNPTGETHATSGTSWLMLE